MKSMRWGRWLLVPVAAAGIWYVALLSGLVAVGVLDALCPADEMVSGLCTAPWHATAVDVLIVAYAAVTAFGIVVVCGFLAPAHKLTVALIAFVRRPVRSLCRQRGHDVAAVHRSGRGRLGRARPRRVAMEQPCDATLTHAVGFRHRPVSEARRSNVPAQARASEWRRRLHP
jgi:hypothetical protein